MKYYIYIVFALALLLSCEKAEKLKSDYFLEVREYSEETVFLTGKEQAVYLWSTKSWADNLTAKIEYVVDLAVLDAYNAGNKKQLKLLPPGCYTTEKTEFNVTDQNRNARFKVMVSPEKIMALGAELEQTEYALPYRILIDGNKSDDKLTTVVVGITVTKPYIYVNGDSIQEFDFITSKHIEASVPIAVNFRNFDGVTPIFSYSPEDVAEYNRENGTNYHALPESAVSWIKEDIVLASDIQNRVARFTIAFDELPHGITLVPITIVGAEEPGISTEPKKYRKLIKLINYITPQSEWMVHASSPTAEGRPEYVIDGRITGSYFWMAGYGSNSPMPRWITLKLKDDTKVVDLRSLVVYTRQGNTWGNKGQKKADILLSMDGENWSNATSYNFLLNPNGSAVQEPQIISFTPTKTRYIKINVTEKYDDGIAFHEIYMSGDITDQ